VCGVDVNGDENDDLLVGAPYYNSQKDGDEGVVFVYLNNGSVSRINESFESVGYTNE